MSYMGLAAKYFDNIPWDSYEHHLFGLRDDNWKKVMEYISRNINVDENLMGKIDFVSDRWDLSIFGQVGTQSDVVYFKRLSNPLKTYVKFFVLYQIGEKRCKPSTPIHRIHDFTNFWSQVTSRLGVTAISDVNEDVIQTFFSEYDVSVSQLRGMYYSVVDVFTFISDNFGVVLNFDIAKLRRKRVSVNYQAKESEEKTPPIPDELYHMILNAYCEHMRDETADNDERMVSALMVEESQTGFRAIDLISTLISRLKTIDVEVNGEMKQMHYIHYINHKPSRPTQVRECDVYCSTLCQEAIDILLRLRKANKYADETDLLFIPSMWTPEKGMNTPVILQTFHMINKVVLLRKLGKQLDRDWEGVTRSKFDGTLHLRESFGIKTDRLAYPNLPQYRVTLATNLYEQGVPLKVIQMTLGHMSDMMEGYYCRPKNDVAEDLAAAHVVLNAISEDALPMIPATGKGDERLLESINAFIAENHVDVRGDIKKVMDEFVGRLSIRAKLGGYCIKGSLLDCAEDANTNEYLCMYGLCPNIRHFFFNAAASYDDFKRTVATYEHADRHNHKKDRLREARKLKAIAENRLLPELDELEKAISQHGRDAVYMKYPSVAYVADNIDLVRKEASEWINRE